VDGANSNAESEIITEMELGHPVTDLGKHISHLKERAHSEMGPIDGFDLEFNFIEKKTS